MIIVNGVVMSWDDYIEMVTRWSSLTLHLRQLAGHQITCLQGAQHPLINCKTFKKKLIYGVPRNEVIIDDYYMS